MCINLKEDNVQEENKIYLKKSKGKSRWGTTTIVLVCCTAQTLVLISKQIKSIDFIHLIVPDNYLTPLLEVLSNGI